MTRVGRLVQLRPDARLDEMSDAGLVAACATDDRTARALLFERHVDAVHRFVGRMRGRDLDMIDDLVQSTFVRAFQCAARFRGDNARAWLFGIAANLVREYARKEIRRKRAHEGVAQITQRSTERRDAHLIARLPEAIAALPHDLRAAFVLVDLEGERGLDAAAALGVPQGTLWRHVATARAKLRDALHGGAT